MPFLLKGYNDFYEGWLARVLEQPRDESQGEAWREGWDMADETGPVVVYALREEVRVGHIVVEPPPSC